MWKKISLNNLFFILGCGLWVGFTQKRGCIGGGCWEMMY